MRTPSCSLFSIEPLFRHEQVGVPHWGRATTCRSTESLIPAIPFHSPGCYDCQWQLGSASHTRALMFTVECFLERPSRPFLMFIIEYFIDIYHGINHAWTSVNQDAKVAWCALAVFQLAAHGMTERWPTNRRLFEGTRGDPRLHRSSPLPAAPLCWPWFPSATREQSQKDEQKKAGRILPEWRAGIFFRPSLIELYWSAQIGLWS